MFHVVAPEEDLDNMCIFVLLLPAQKIPALTIKYYF
jgi:hypothetical protein